jgi:sigma-B regulation protein RsbU (phosphoserine phosphatase)
MFKQIKTRVLTVILSTSLGALLFLSIVCMISIFNIRKVSLVHSDQLGGMAAEDGRVALEIQMQRQLMTLAQDKASLADGKLSVIQNQTKMMAEMATHLATDKSHYVPRKIDYIYPDQLNAISDHTDGLPLQLATAGDITSAAVWDEIYLMANIGDLLHQISVIDIGITDSYIGTESGFFLIIRDAAFTDPKAFDARTRSWYIGAKERDGLYWTDIFADAITGVPSISCAMPFYDLSGGKRVFKGVAANGTELSENVHKIIDSTKIGETGYAFLLNEKGQVIVSPKSTGVVTDKDGIVIGEDYLGSGDPSIRELARHMLDRESGFMEMEMDGKVVYVAFHPLETLNWSLGVVAAVDEIIAPAENIRQGILSITRNEIIAINRSILVIILIMLAVIGIALVVIVFVVIGFANSLTAPIISLTRGAVTISAGDLDYRFDVKTGDEIEILANSFNQMIDDIHTITAEKQRISSELTIASEIQNDMMPRIFPSFSNHKFFSVFAKMEPAKEVGGDFYDFFYLDPEETKIVFVIADVSGKGVPAALFMVIAKTLIKQQMISFGDPAVALEQVNKILCKDNPRSMFVTVLIYALDLVTGQMIYANGGHNPPLLSVSNQAYHFMELKKGIPPGMMEESKYKLCFTQLQRGDRLYLYTDGINEAMNPDGEQFGNERFLAAANKYRDLPPQQFDEAIRQEVVLFTNGAEQSDDITTIAISYLGEDTFYREITLIAALENLDPLLDWVSEILDGANCTAKLRNQVAVVTEEIFVNIASYAYQGKAGEAVIRMGLDEKQVILQFEDAGVPFNPLEHKAPYTGVGIEERPIGGLGINITKKWMDKVLYKRDNEKNILTLYKTLAVGA